ncbi:MAG TPA: glutathione S-transferase N-terminal domain-containing protein [Vitreimonas sp.]|uniref:glutathione S-transferase family protein n=1 Tax=Vitreimonas sp. TaxID=3069702 RepID=UPI002D72DE06|nr:glutathione S-transferase N-terminal domain-containing protein [Vitreimonas sp.]HYD86895.1 glutathione S-transferase N-terminal domain-containing protein [Vitreimonas sp.]
MTKPIELYFWPTPNGWKISIALEEMGLPYEVKPVNIGKGEQFAPGFLKISPNNRMPAIVDPEGPGGAPISVFESGAILQYLGRKSGKLYPADERAKSEVEQWLIWQVANLGPIAGQVSHFVNYAPKLVDDPALIEYGRARYVNELNRLCGVMEKRLGEAPFLGGEYSIADIAAWPWARIVHKLGQSFDDFPKVKDWVDRIYDRPAVQRALKVGEELKQKQATSKEDVREAAKHLFGQTANSVNDAKSKQG